MIPKIITFVFLQHIKTNLVKMKKYLVLCKFWNEQLKNLSSKCHELLYGNNLYSMKNMIEMKSGVFLEDLKRTKTICEKHIRFECEVG